MLTAVLRSSSVLPVSENMLLDYLQHRDSMTDVYFFGKIPTGSLRRWCWGQLGIFHRETGQLSVMDTVEARFKCQGESWIR